MVLSLCKSFMLLALIVPEVIRGVPITLGPLNGKKGWLE